MTPLENTVARLRMMVSRGRVVKTVLNAKRAMLQLAGISDEVRDQIELILPYGMSANPPAGGDVVLLQVGGSRAHLVALGADDPALRIADLAAGEFGFRDARGQQVVFRTDRLEITTPLKVVGTITGDLDLTVNGNVNLTATGNAVVKAASVALGDTGGKKIALDGDPVVNGQVQASSTKVTAV